MKSKKNKNKLESLKEDDNLTSEDQSVLDQEIQFEDHEDKTEHSTPTLGEKTSVGEQTARQETRVYAQKKNRQDRDEGTAVLNEQSRSITSASQLTGGGDESTYREITAGRRGRADTEKVSYGDVYENDNGLPSRGESVEGVLKQAEHLRLAQDKINELEGEIEDLRRENDELLSAADTFKALSEDY